MDDRVRKAYIEPKWFRRESEQLAREWLESDSDLEIIDYVLQHASDQYKKEYERAVNINKAS